MPSDLGLTLGKSPWGGKPTNQPTHATRTENDDPQCIQLDDAENGAQDRRQPGRQFIREDTNPSALD